MRLDPLVRGHVPFFDSQVFVVEYHRLRIGRELGVDGIWSIDLKKRLQGLPGKNVNLGGILSQYVPPIRAESETANAVAQLRHEWRPGHHIVKDFLLVPRREINDCGRPVLELGAIRISPLLNA